MDYTIKITYMRITYAIIILLLLVTHDSFAQSTARKYPVTESQASAIVQKALKVSPVIDGHNDLFAWYFGCDYKRLKNVRKILLIIHWIPSAKAKLIFLAGEKVAWVGYYSMCLPIH